MAWTVNRAQLTHRLPTSSMESRDAAPGNQFVVLDVSVRNRDAGQQVLAEGALIAMDESKLQTFDRPVTVLSDDDYLSLQVLAPSQQLRGKIAYEVPEHLPGVLYWSPGNGSRRILLNPVAPAVSQRTLANVEDAGADSAATPAIAVARAAPRDAGVAQAAEPLPPSAAQSDHALATRPRSPSTVRVAARQIATTSPQPSPRSAAPPLRVAPVEVAATMRPPPIGAVPSASSAATATPPAPRVDTEQARHLACQGLVTRDDPAEKERSLGFFAESCRDYALPPHWQPRTAHRSLVDRASAMLGRLVVAPRAVRISDCSNASASQADRLVCGDPRLSAMDHRLAQSVARASEQVDNPAALQREQDEWRGRVRNACDTTGCLEQVYGRRIAQLDAITPMRP
ncbi:MAG: DUF4352 domain-containing protein [Luteimonas sp.]